jgi:hypothetical protein
MFNFGKTKEIKKGVEPDESCNCKNTDPAQCAILNNHNCCCLTLGPVFCRRSFNDHPCICNEQLKLIGYCKAKEHRCVCNRVLIGHDSYENEPTESGYCIDECRALKYKHLCICTANIFNNKFNDVSMCKYTVHTDEEIKKGKLELKTEFNESHACICLYDKQSKFCKSTIGHDINCTCHLQNCESTHHTICICTEDLGKCKVCPYSHNCNCSNDPDECIISHWQRHECICHHRINAHLCKALNHTLYSSYFRTLRLWLFPLTEDETIVQMDPIPLNKKDI